MSLLLARLALIFISFPKLARRFGTFVPPDDDRALQAKIRGTEQQVDLAEKIGWAVTRAARNIPFKAVCLPQAMAARVMLKRRGLASVVHFGATRSDGKAFEAHAWLDAAGVEVTGYPVAKEFLEIACFV